MVSLSSNEIALYFELYYSDNPTQALSKKYSLASEEIKQELNDNLRGLERNGLIDIRWASNVPYKVNTRGSSDAVIGQLVNHKSSSLELPKEKPLRRKIFISHRSVDKQVVDLLIDYLVRVGIPRSVFFCSSRPGNDVNEKISDEIKHALRESVLNIAVLSRDYYTSVYCQNEAGIIWYEDIPMTLIALPEISIDNMIGFLNADYILRRLDNSKDISDIYDKVAEVLSCQREKAAVIVSENEKLIKDYSKYLGMRKKDTAVDGFHRAPLTFEQITDDEKIVLYFMLKNNLRQVTKESMQRYFDENEICGLSIVNAFDLLAAGGEGALSGELFEMSAESFRKFTIQSKDIVPSLEKCVEKYKQLAVYSFLDQWKSGAVDENNILFVAYLVDERVESLGARWKADHQIGQILQWEKANELKAVVSTNYTSCLEYFVNNHFAYASEWTSYGNPRSYKLYPSVVGLFTNCPDEMISSIKMIKKRYRKDGIES